MAQRFPNRSGKPDVSRFLSDTICLSLPSPSARPSRKREGTARMWVPLPSGRGHSRCSNDEDRNDDSRCAATICLVAIRWYVHSLPL